MLKFSTSPERNRSYCGQSPWVLDLYKKYFGDNHDGFLVEIGVGCVLDWKIMSPPPYTPRLVDFEKDDIVRGESTTIELLENGWTGIYIDPIEEFLTNELHPLLKSLLPMEQYKKIQIVPYAASDYEGSAEIISQETINPVSNESSSITNFTPFIPYNYKNRKIKCKPTSQILSDCNCPKDIDVMSVDVEGHELYVLRGLDFLIHRPKFILLECDKVSINQLISALPPYYRLVMSDGLNAAFVVSELV
tara:strand:+ start:6914 stop:7657 length:744 start_codon:yes stop_codon:yes gene_type:complete